MAITNFITSVWSETLLNSLEQEYVAVRNCNREFEGDIKAKGDRVKVCAVSSVSIFSYHKNMDLQDPQVLDDKAVRLSADISRAFNFQIDDIDNFVETYEICKESGGDLKSAVAKCTTILSS